MFELEFNKRYLVKDSSHIGLLYYIRLQESIAFNDLVIVHDELYNESYYMTLDEVKEEFTFIS